MIHFRSSDYVEKSVCFAHSKIFIIFNPLNPEFTIFIFIHYKPRIAVAISDL